MSDRLCGYCRKPEHTKNKCPLRLEQIDIIRRHVGDQRKLAQQILLANGIGVGAIVTATDYWSGTESPCIVPSLKVIESYIDWRIVKYKKQVRATLGVYGLDVPDSKCDALIRYNTKNRICLPVYKMDDMSCTMTAYFLLDRLEKPLVRVSNQGSWDYNKHSTILSPSQETDVTTDDLQEQFLLHERLTLDPKNVLTTPL